MGLNWPNSLRHRHTRSITRPAQAVGVPHTKQIHTEIPSIHPFTNSTAITITLEGTLLSEIAKSSSWLYPQWHRVSICISGAVPENSPALQTTLYWFHMVSEHLIIKHLKRSITMWNQYSDSDMLMQYSLSRCHYKIKQQHQLLWL